MTRRDVMNWALVILAVLAGIGAILVGDWYRGLPWFLVALYADENNRLHRRNNR